MSLYGRIFAAGYDVFMKGTEASTFGAHRAALLGCLRGRVVEIGGGRGANLPYYGAAVTELAITEPKESMARRLDRQLSERSLHARVVRAPAEELPFED